MKRKDLKPGTVFRYVWSDIGNTYYVPPHSSPGINWLSSEAPGTCNEDEVIVIALPPISSGSSVSPPHYQALGVEPIDAIESWDLNFRLANVVKYIARAGKKPGADAKEDLLKARAYLSREIAVREGRRAWE